ncbi:MAG TPA: energy transducer TonB [Candidatus Angelobacter sp.]|jgi:protein TonB|nr:energy transducer TonB [Candidatus Angelobacter sp.]
MLNQEQPRESTGWKFSHPASVAIHCLVLWALLWSSPLAVFVKPSSIQRGDRGIATLVYLAPRGPQQTIAVASRKEALTFLKAARAKEQQERSFKPQPPEEPPKAETVDAKAGSPFGSVSEGATTGADVRPAIPMLFPDPPNLRSTVPYGVQGDVVVEVTIDAQGNVVETKILKAIGYGVEEKVLEAVKNWRFRPATRDGVAIPSKHDVLYHFPS